MNANLLQTEIDRVLKKLKDGKSSGVDKVVGEVLKHGGQWMARSVWRLCCTVWEGEELPHEWLRAIKVPVKKKGSGEEFDDYRGVTLLSVIGKVYAMVLEARVREFAESRGLLSHSQFGFRQGKACRDPLFVLSELERRRGKKPLYAGFLDIAKAYPSVWWDGLWKKLLDMGVEGRMWRVLRSFYSKYEVGVRVQGTVDEWYEEFLGVREGCVLSPLLFALYIDGVVKELAAEGGKGVPVGKGIVRVLLFADDIVIVDESAEGLQKSLDVMWRYSRKWRFEYNFGPDKSAIMVFGGRGKRRTRTTTTLPGSPEEWKMGDTVMTVVDNYQYLGVRFIKKGGWKTRRKELLMKMRRNFWRAWGLGMGGGELTSEGAAALWVSLVKSVLEYGGEVDSDRWEEAEKFQRMAGRMALGVGKGVADEVVLGDLGWWSIRGRREYLRLKYWAKMVREKDEGIVGMVYEEGRRRIEKGEARATEWCVETKRIMVEMGLEEEWRTQDVGSQKEWNVLLKAMMQAREEGRWRKGIMTGGAKGAAKTKLMRYARIKTKLVREGFLGEDRVWVRRWVKLRAGVEDLEVERGRRRRIPRKERVCTFCRQGVEDEDHFIEKCERWREERKEMRRRVEVVSSRRWKTVTAWGANERVDWLLRGAEGKKKSRVIMKAVVCMLFARDRARRVIERVKKKRDDKQRGEGCKVEVVEETFEVEQLVDRRKISGKEVEYCVKWVGYTREHNSWEPRSEMVRNCGSLVRALDVSISKDESRGGVVMKKRIQYVLPRRNRSVKKKDTG